MTKDGVATGTTSPRNDMIATSGLRPPRSDPFSHCEPALAGEAILTCR